MDVSDGVNPPNTDQLNRQHRLNKGRESRIGASARRNVRDLIRPFDPTSPQAEAEYNEVVDRLNQVRRQRVVNDRERLELERQFVEDDLTIRSGDRVGEPLSSRGRRRRLRSLVKTTAAAHRLSSEECFLIRILEKMNEELERWAREIYGV